MEKSSDIIEKRREKLEALKQQDIPLYPNNIKVSHSVGEIRGLIDKHPHNIVIRGERTRELAKELLDEQYVISVRLADGEIRVEVSDPEGFFSSIPGIVAGMDVRVDEMYSLDDSLEAVFEYLVEG